MFVNGADRDAGFKSLNQAQLLSDALYYSNNLDAQQWLVYYISRPLVGSFEPIKISPAILPTIRNDAHNSEDGRKGGGENGGGGKAASSQSKKNIKSFNDLLNNFPMIARQMQTGLERVFKDVQTETKNGANERQAPKHPGLSRRHSNGSSQSGSNGSIHSRYSNGSIRAPSVATLNVNDEEAKLRRTLENAVTAAIDLFQMVDKQQLTLLGTTTELTGQMVERLIERYITEQLHDASLFPMLCSSRKLEDLELQSQVHQMQYLDISQVGIAIENGRRGRESLTRQLHEAVQEFRKLGVSGSPQQMVEILLSTLRLLTNPGPEAQSKDGEVSEKNQTTMTMNADTLVSLLLVVVIRSQVRHLQASLSYMRNFIFIDDVETGEAGYALSTFEAVLSYLATDSSGLRRASKRNKRLWQATRDGSVAELKNIIESEDPNPVQLNGSHDEGAQSYPQANGEPNSGDTNSTLSDAASEPPLDCSFSQSPTLAGTPSEGPSLAHVFPFQAQSDELSLEPPLPKRKRVSMDMRSLSISSEFSAISRTTTMDSRASAIEGDTSVETLLQTQDPQGNSVLMMAVEARQPGALSYLLHLEEYFPLGHILEDANSEDTTLLSAAVQSGDSGLIEVILAHILQERDDQILANYLARPDRRGRTVAHYMFHAPELIVRFGEMLPWRLKDKNGQTPLLALCRSYDHSSYAEMVSNALDFTSREQDDREPLHVDEHIDGKGNTLLHAVSDSSLALRILRECDSDANAMNDKMFTPLMVASKYGRIDMVRTLFGDRRVDIQAKELRGMTAVELAKDDEVRNRIDDMVLVSNVPAADGRVTSVVRSFFVEDASIRLIIKSAIRNDNGMIGVTTCRRSLEDFENLARWLSLEHPASWLPSTFNYRSPYQISSRPSRAVLQDIQVRLDRFLKIMLAHSNFSTHELLWEFILFPEIQPDMMAERSRKKAETRTENIRDEYEPIEDVKDVEAFVGYARETLRPVNHSTSSLMRRVTAIQNGSTGMSLPHSCGRLLTPHQTMRSPSSFVYKQSTPSPSSQTPIAKPSAATSPATKSLNPTPTRSSTKTSKPSPPPSSPCYPPSLDHIPSSTPSARSRKLLIATARTRGAQTAGPWAYSTTPGKACRQKR